ncbi:MAG: hypothetical protein V1816_16375 [Pseudomonadota bacterium]
MDVGPVYRGWQYTLYVRPGKSVIAFASASSAVSQPQCNNILPRDETSEKVRETQNIPRVNEPRETSFSGLESSRRVSETLLQNNLAQEIMVGQKLREAKTRVDYTSPQSLLVNDAPREKDKNLNQDGIFSISLEIDQIHLSHRQVEDAVVLDRYEILKTNESQPVNSGQFLRDDEHVAQLEEYVNRDFRDHKTTTIHNIDRQDRQTESDDFRENRLTLDLSGPRGDNPFDLNPDHLGEPPGGTVGDKIADAALKKPDDSFYPPQRVGIINLDADLKPSDDQPWPIPPLADSNIAGGRANIPEINAADHPDRPGFAGNILENPPANVTLQSLDVSRDHDTITHERTRTDVRTDVFRSQDVLKTQTNSVLHDLSIYTESVFNPLDFFPVKQELVESMVLDRGKYNDNVSGSYAAGQPQIPITGDIHQRTEEFPLAANIIQAEGKTERGEAKLEGTHRDAYSVVGQSLLTKEDQTFNPEPVYLDVVEKNRDFRRDDFKMEVTDRVLEKTPLSSRVSERRTERVEAPPPQIEPNQLTHKITEESKYSRQVVGTSETELEARPVEYYDGFSWSRDWTGTAEESEKMAAMERAAPILTYNEIYTTHSELKGLTVDKLVVDWSR